MTWAPAREPADFDARARCYDRRAEFDLEIARRRRRQRRARAHRAVDGEGPVANYAPGVLNHPLTGSALRASTTADSSDAGRRPRPGSRRAGLQTLAGAVGTTATRAQRLRRRLQRLRPVRRPARRLRAHRPGDRRRRPRLLRGPRATACTSAPVPEASSARAAQPIAYGQAFQGEKVYGALYGPWIIVPDPHRAGDDPRTVRSRRRPRHGRLRADRDAPAASGRRRPATRPACSACSTSSTGSPTPTTPTSCQDGSVNGIRAIPGAGIVVDASRTLSTDTRWLLRQRAPAVQLRQEQPARRACAGCARSRTATTLWNADQVRQRCTPFLLGLWRQGAFGTGTPEEVFTVIVRRDEQPARPGRAGQLHGRGLLLPVQPGRDDRDHRRPAAARRHGGRSLTAQRQDARRTRMPQVGRLLRVATGPTSSSLVDRRRAEPRRHARSPGSARASSTRSSSPTAAPTTSTRSPAAKVKFEPLTIERYVDGSPEDKRFQDWFAADVQAQPRPTQGGSSVRKNGMIDQAPQRRGRAHASPSTAPGSSRRSSPTSRPARPTCSSRPSCSSTKGLERVD